MLCCLHCPFKITNYPTRGYSQHANLLFLEPNPTACKVGKNHNSNQAANNTSTFSLPEALKALLPAEVSSQLTPQMGLSMFFALRHKERFAFLEIWCAPHRRERNQAFWFRGLLFLFLFLFFYFKAHCLFARQRTMNHSQWLFARCRVKVFFCILLKPGNESMKKISHEMVFRCTCSLFVQAFILKGYAHLFQSLTFIPIQATINSYWKCCFHDYCGT